MRRARDDQELTGDQEHDPTVIPNHKKPRSERASRWRRPKLWPFFIGAVFILLGIALEHPMLLGHGSADAAESSSSIFIAKTIVLWASEIGYAFFIAGIVSWFIEASARQEQNDDFRSAREAISKDVFQGVFGIRHSKEYVRAVIGTCLESAMVREDYELTYEIDPFPPAEADRLGIEPDRFVLVRASIRYTARNLGPERAKFPTGYGIPVRSGGLRDFSKMETLQIGPKIFTPQEIAALEVVPADGDTHGERTYDFPVELDPQASASVALTVSLVKELSDNDPFGFRRPTMGCRITLSMGVPGLRFGATPRTSAKLVEVRSPVLGRTGEWRIEGPILPFDSVILWWRSPEDDGSDATSDETLGPAPTEADSSDAVAPPRKLWNLRGIRRPRTK